MKRQRTTIIFLLMTLLITISAFTMSLNVKAVPSKEDVYENAPTGMRLGDFVTVPTSYKYTNGSTSTFSSSGSTVYNNPNYPSDIVQLMSKSNTATNQISSVWGTINTDSNNNKTYNYFDLNKNQEISAWIYNGDSDTQVTDGFAFVLQNDPNGFQAISRKNGIPSAGETLGVWGTTGSIGIAQSVAIEFDRIFNGSTKAGNNLDYGTYTVPTGLPSPVKSLKEKHISWNYPGSLNAYVGTDILMHLRVPTTVSNYAYISGYDGIGKRPGGDDYDPKDAWRHIQINYTAPVSGSTEGDLAFKINDKYQDGTEKGLTSQNTGHFAVNTQAFNAKDGKVYWGFTTSTGSPNTSTQDVAMVFEKMPAIADVKADVVMTDLTNNETSTTSTPVETYDGDDLEFNYSLKYTGGISETGTIDTKMALPDSTYVDYSGDSDGNIGKITYTDANGSITKIENISASQLEDMVVTVPADKDGDPPTEKTIKGVNLTLDTIKAVNEKINIEIYGKAKAPASDKETVTTVSSEHTAYRSDNYSGDVSSPSFTINNNPLRITNTNDLNQTATVDDKGIFQGTVNYAKNTAFDGKNLTGTIQVYDDTGKLVNIGVDNTIAVASGATQGSFDLSYVLSELTSGKTYTFDINLTDGNKRVSNTLTYTIKVEDNKQLVISKKDFTSHKIVEQGNQLELNVFTKYDDNKTNVDSTKIKTYLKIDDGQYAEGSVDPVQNALNITFNWNVDTSDLALGEHTLSVYASDQKKDSNVLEYTFKVIDHGLVLTPKEKVITVKNNDPVQLDWTVAYNSNVDDGTQNNVLDVRRNTLQIKNEGDTEFRDFDIYINKPVTNDPSFANPVEKITSTPSFDLNPIKSVGYNSFLNLLKEGRNEVKFSVSSKGLTSAEETVYIDVPHLTLELTSTTKDLYASTTTGSMILDFTYNYSEDAEYTTDIKNLPPKLMMNYSINDSSLNGVRPFPNTAVDEKDFQAKLVLGEFTGLKLNNDYLATAEAEDPYGRAAPYEFNLHIISKHLSLEVDDSKFRDITPLDKIDSYIQRQGLWNVSVNELGSKWTLKAQSDGLTSDNESTYHKNMIFIDSNQNVSKLTDNPEIASQDTPVKTQNKITNLAEGWSDDEGILLINQKPDLMGDYHGTIKWLLEDVLDN